MGLEGAFATAAALVGVKSSSPSESEEAGPEDEMEPERNRDWALDRSVEESAVAVGAVKPTPCLRGAIVLFA